MKNKETVFVCSNCGNEFGKWMGQCSGCGEWNSLKEVSNKFGGNGKIKNKTIKMGGEKLEVKNLGNLDKQICEEKSKYHFLRVFPNLIEFWVKELFRGRRCFLRVNRGLERVLY